MGGLWADCFVDRIQVGTSGIRCLALSGAGAFWVGSVFLAIGLHGPVRWYLPVPFVLVPRYCTGAALHEVAWRRHEDKVRTESAETKTQGNQQHVTSALGILDFDTRKCVCFV